MVVYWLYDTDIKLKKYIFKLNVHNVYYTQTIMRTFDELHAQTKRTILYMDVKVSQLPHLSTYKPSGFI